jgi:ACS family hexuronate transporter-like MFS transporter
VSTAPIEPVVVASDVHLRIRWTIGGLLFLVTVLNYVDRQVFSILAPDLQDAIHWSELDYSRIVNAFQLAYAIAMVFSGRILDRIGTKIGLAASVVLWSAAEAAHALARTPLGFGLARFALGIGEAANFPAALKAVSEWFPARERALATGLFNSGVALGTILASVGVPLMAAAYGWRATFVATGVLGMLWVPFWWFGYRSGLTSVGSSLTIDDHGPAVPWRTLLGLRQTWAYAVTKSLGDPIWWFYLFWLPKYLAAEFHVRGTAVIPYLTAVYVCADVGCLGAGWLSSVLVTRGWSINRARKGTMGLLAVVMTPSVVVAGTLHDPRLAIALIAIACGAHQAWSTMVFTVATDLFPSRALGSVSGFGGFLAGMVSIVAAELVGRVLDRDATLYLPIFIAAGLLYPIALLVFHLLSPRMEPARLDHHSW